MSEIKRESIKNTIALLEPTVTTIGGIVNLEFDKNSYSENCPVDMSVVKKLEDFNFEYLEEVANKTTDVAIEKFLEDDNFTEAMAHAPYLSDSSTTFNVLKNYETTNSDGVQLEEPHVISSINMENKLQESFKRLEGKIKKSI